MTATMPKQAVQPVVSVSGLRIELSGSRRVIAADVNLEIGPGEILGLVGESGSGKTTVGTAMLGFVRRGAQIVDGHVMVDDIDVLRLGEAALQTFRGHTISYVPQDPAAALNPALRVGAQLREMLEIHEAHLDDDQRAERLREVLTDVALPTDRLFLRRFPHQLSGGQQQRVCLAMAFVLRPSAIVLDEPTTGLDVTTQARVLAIVRDLCDTYRVAALYITHDLAVIAGLAHRVAVMCEGHVVEQGDCEQVLRSPRHEYTRALVAAVPDIGDHPQREPATAPTAVSPPAVESRDGEARLRAALQALGPGEIALTVRDLRCDYGGDAVIEDASMVLRRGECLALVGESGSGKTTLARSIIGLHPPRSGDIALAGHVLAAAARARPAVARCAMQYVFQNPYGSLNPRMPVGQLLAKPYQLFYGGSRQDALHHVYDALERVALHRIVAHQYPDQLSGGERQRVAIARALVCKPSVLICDEVTSALDVSVQAQILELLAQLKADEQISILFVTHNLAVVRHVADRVAVLQKGRIAEEGPTDGVLDAPQHPYTQSLLRDTPSWSLRN